VRRPQPTVRLRLTILYGTLFLVTGMLLLALTYGLLTHNLHGRRNGAGGDGSNQQSTQDHQGGRQDETGSNSASAQESVDQQVESARRDAQDTALEQVLVQGGIAMALATFAALAFGWLIAGRVLKPIRSITAHARHASEATLSERIDLRGPPDELKELADTIDAMLARLEAAFAAQRRFSAEASHELRTPLTIIRAEAEVALAADDATERERRLASSVRDAVDRSEQLVDGLLALARSESTLRDETTIDLADLVGDVVGEQAQSADAVGVELDLVLGVATVMGDRMLLWRMVGNLVENAIRYNRPQGWVKISVDTESRMVAVSVENSGPVVDPKVVAELFEPFHRGVWSRQGFPSGHGLGLTIVRSVAAIHGGRVEATARDGGGLLVMVLIPSAPVGTAGAEQR
jgi:signal transduction histidine kinase